MWHENRGGGIRKKGEGPGVMVSAFIIEELGFLSLSADEFECFKQRRAEAGKAPPKFFTEYQGRICPSVFLFEYGKNRDGYWSGDDMVMHIDEFSDFLEIKLPSRGHAKYRSGAPHVHNMGGVNYV